jgi:hypothetical protein
VAKSWEPALARWTESGVIDEDTAARIRAFELARAASLGLGWPIWLALAFGALLVGAGVLLFVSAHWDSLSPSARFGLVLVLVAVFHLGGAVMADRFPAMATALHAVGTVALGAGVFLAGQIFNLEEHWPGGLMFWALGAAAGLLLLRDWPQLALTALLVPAWLVGEWMVAATRGPLAGDSRGLHVAEAGVFLLALAYFTAMRGERDDARRRSLMWLGGAALIPASLVLSSPDWLGMGRTSRPIIPFGLLALGWTVAIAGPLFAAFMLRGRAAWTHAIAAAWVLLLFAVRAAGGPTAAYAWWATGATALAAWGVREGRNERINMGAVIFAATVLAFYFSQVMDKLGRSLSLVGLGILFLAGGWALDRLRRRLVNLAQGATR